MNRRTVLKRIGAASVGTAVLAGEVTAEGRADVRTETIDGVEYVVPEGVDPDDYALKQDVDSSDAWGCCIGVTGCDVSCDECYICEKL